YTPSVSVAVCTAVPATTTLTPAKGAPCSSRTVPCTIRCCCWACTVTGAAISGISAVRLPANTISQQAVTPCLYRYFLMSLLVYMDTFTHLLQYTLTRAIRCRRPVYHWRPLRLPYVARATPRRWLQRACSL